jgi:hypothetical protein
MLELFIE